jgi:hypothetical protein
MADATTTPRIVRPTLQHEGLTGGGAVAANDNVWRETHRELFERLQCGIDAAGHVIARQQVPYIVV